MGWEAWTFVRARERAGATPGDSQPRVRSVADSLRRALRIRIAPALALGCCLSAVPLGTPGDIVKSMNGGGGAARAEQGTTDPRRAETIVLLHGLGRSATNMLILEWRLEARGYRVCNIGYDTRVPRIEDAIAEVYTALEACRTDGGRLHFVTHSLGGLVLRGLLSSHTLAELGHAVMLAPPNRGSEIADRLRAWGWLGPVMGPLSTQLGTGEEDLPQQLPVPTIPFGVIAGDQWINPAGPLWLPSPHDGTVSVASTRLAGMRDHIVMPYTHTFIMNAAPVADQIDAFLRHGRFARAVGTSSETDASGG